MANDQVKVTTNSGIGVCGLLGVLFIALKLTHVIAWSWLWVLAPFWVPVAAAVLVILVFGIAMLLGA